MCTGGASISAYRRALEIVSEAGLRSIAFPSISTGAYCFPIRAAAVVALGTTTRFLASPGHGMTRVRFVLFSDVDLTVYADVLEHL